MTQIDKAVLDRYLTSEPFNGIESWYEKVIDHIPLEVVSEEDYERSENWFIEVADSLFQICPDCNPEVTAKFIIECWALKQNIEEQLYED